MNQKLFAQDDTLSLLHCLSETFNMFSVVYWLDAGTLLKAVRDSNIIPSSDLDFGSWQTEIDKILSACEKLRREGFKIKYQGFLPFVEDHIQIFIPNKYKVSFKHIDIYMYRELGSEAVRRNIHRPVQKTGRILMKGYLSAKKYRSEKANFKDRLLNAIPFVLRMKIAKIIFSLYVNTCKSLWFVVEARFFKNLSSKVLYGINFKIPSSVFSYLEYRYGPNWTVKNKNWRLADGKIVRFRRINRIRRKERIFRETDSDNIVISRDGPEKGIFKFTEEEIMKIKRFK